LKGGLSGGTLASGMATQAAAQKDPGIGSLLADPFALTPGFKGPAQPDGDKPYEDKVTGSWVGPFMMAGINTKAVHRTNLLKGHPWGRDFRYDEMQMLEGPRAPDSAASTSVRAACRSPARGRPRKSATAASTTWCSSPRWPTGARRGSP